jgi:hypothetical protein
MGEPRTPLKGCAMGTFVVVLIHGQDYGRNPLNGVCACRS